MLLIMLLATDVRGFAVVQAKDLSISCRNPSFRTSNGISSLFGSGRRGRAVLPHRLELQLRADPLAVLHGLLCPLERTAGL